MTPYLSIPSLDLAVTPAGHETRTGAVGGGVNVQRVQRTLVGLDLRGNLAAFFDSVNRGTEKGSVK